MARARKENEIERRARDEEKEESLIARRREERRRAKEPLLCPRRVVEGSRVHRQGFRPLRRLIVT